MSYYEYLLPNREITREPHKSAFAKRWADDSESGYEGRTYYGGWQPIEDKGVLVDENIIPQKEVENNKSTFIKNSLLKKINTSLGYSASDIKDLEKELLELKTKIKNETIENKRLKQLQQKIKNNTSLTKMLILAKQLNGIYLTN